MLPRKKVKLHNRNLFPAFIDYDVSNLKCRGMSAKLDLFSYGLLNEVLSSVSPKELEFIRTEGLFIKKNGLFTEEGFFLLDFENVMKNPEHFKEKLSSAGFSEVFFEDSARFDLEPFFNNLKGVSVRLMEFDNDPYG